jgi:extracellular elastinolytic metalloproteinase
LHGTFDSKVKPKLEYLVKADHSVVLVHVLSISNDKDFTFYEAFVNAHTGVVESVIDFVNHITYRVVPIWKQSVAEGQEDLVNPQDTIASPNGWHNAADTVLQTRGNNVVTSPLTSQSGSEAFLYTYDPSQEPSTSTNKAAAV